MYLELREYGKAKKLQERNLWIRKKVLGEDHPSTAIGYNNLAVLYESQGKYKDAMTYYLKAYKIFVSKFEEGHPYTKNAYENMEKTYSEWNTEGDFEQWLEEKMKEEE